MDSESLPSNPSIFWPVTLSFIGAPLAVAGNLVATGVAALGGSSRPWAAAEAWATFWGPLSVYAPLIFLLVWRSRLDGLTLSELLRYRRSKLGIDLTLGVAIGIGMAFSAAIIGALATEVFPEIGDSLLYHADASKTIPLPAWFFAWSVLVTPLGAALVEELTYRGYALPKLLAARLKPGTAIGLTSLGFGLQHVAFPFVDPNVSIYRSVAIFVIGCGLGWTYLKLGRLLPLVIGHYLWDVLPPALAVGIMISRAH